MSSDSATARGTVLDALLFLAARGEVPASDLARVLGLGHANGRVIRLRPVLAVLNQLVDAGGYAAAWAVIAELLPWVLPRWRGERADPGAADLVALGVKAQGLTETYRSGAGHGHVAADTVLAVERMRALVTRKGTSRVTQECRRLLGQLGPPADSVRHVATRRCHRPAAVSSTPRQDGPLRAGKRRGGSGSGENVRGRGYSCPPVD